MTYLSWHWIFYINVPIGIAGFLLTGRYIVQLREARHLPFDFLGFGLSGLCLASLMFGFELASRGAVPVWESCAVLGAGLLAGLAYARHARHAETRCWICA